MLKSRIIEPIKFGTIPWVHVVVGVGIPPFLSGERQAFRSSCDRDRSAFQLGIPTLLIFHM